MGARSVYFNDEMETLLKTYKDNDPDFNLTDFVKAALIGDDSRLTQEQIDVKIKKAEYDKAQIELELEHLNRIVPYVVAKEEESDAEAEQALKNAIDVIRRNKGKPKFEEYAAVQSRLTGKPVSELIELAEEPEYINVYKLEDTSIDRLSDCEQSHDENEVHLSSNNLNKQEDNNGNTTENRHPTNGDLD